MVLLRPLVQQNDLKISALNLSRIRSGKKLSQIELKSESQIKSEAVSQIKSDMVSCQIPDAKIFGLLAQRRSAHGDCDVDRVPGP